MRRAIGSGHSAGTHRTAYQSPQRSHFLETRMRSRMSGLLSHSECEALLLTAKSTPSRSREPLHSNVTQEASAGWMPLNFIEPAPLSSTAVELLVAIQAGLCQQLEKLFQLSLGTAIRFRPVGLNTVRFDTPDLNDSSLACQFSNPAEPLPWRVSWQPELAHTLIALLLGGDQTEPIGSTSGSLSEIENRLLIRLCKTFLEAFDNTNSIASLNHPWVTTTERDSRVAPPEIGADSFLRASFEVSCNGRNGLVDCWLPSASVIERRPLKTPMPEPELLPGPTPALANSLEQLRCSPKFKIAAELDCIKLRATQVAELSIGDILMTDVSQLDDVSLRLDGRKLFGCTAGALDGKKSVRLSTFAHSDVD